MSVELYRKNVGKLEKILTYKQDLLKLFGQNNLQQIKSSVCTMKNDIDDVLDGKSINAEDKETLVRRILNLLINIVITHPIVPILKDLSIEFSLLAFNWNQMTIKSHEVKVLSLTLRRLIDTHWTMMDAIIVMKKLLREFKNFKHFYPPAFELSKSYLQSLQEKGATNLKEGCTAHGASEEEVDKDEQD
ncbi:MAG: hypothetical protein DRP74_00500 [Candidatus Omnitrophota bacterium]|nr:MAG: hypothetical protein DRP74_00500 [Candidatus Omnitrophota bacterium]